MRKNITKYLVIITLLSVGIGGFNTITAQNTRRTQDTVTTYSHAEHGVGWLRSPLADNWFIQVQGGVNLYEGFDDNQGPLRDHVGKNIEGYIGHWIFPMLGLRIGGGYGSAYGFITCDNYDTYHPAVGYGESYGTSGQGNALGGYYWPYGDDGTLLRQQWTHAYGGFDLLLDLSNLRRYQKYNPNARWQHIGYAGSAIHIGLNEDHPEVSRSVDANIAAEGHVGYMGRFSVSSHFSIYLDARLSLFEGNFDREKVSDEHITPDLMPSLMVGVNYGFNWRRPTRRNAYYEQAGLVQNSSDTPIPQFLHYVQTADRTQHFISITDSLYLIDTLYNEALMDLIDSMERQHTKLLPYKMVFFPLDQWDIMPSEDLKIEQMAQIIKHYPDKTFLLISSADSVTGTVKRNIFLSQHRADTVFTRLTQQYGVNPKQLEIQSLGGILDFDPFPLNRTTIIIMKDAAFLRALEQMRAVRKAGDNTIEYDD